VSNKFYSGKSMSTNKNHKDLKQAGLKITIPRIKILNILEQYPNRHISAEDIYKILMEAGDDVGLATVYRVLTQFESAGLVIRHGFADGRAIFELDQGEHHDHLLCTQCGKVEEFVDSFIEEQQLKIAASRNFKMTDHCLYIYGICEVCSALD
jgi:Fur family transcriptional regulator, ferric uptake regulator